MRRCLLALTLAAAAMTCGGMLAARAEDWKATGEFDWHGTGGRMYELEKGHTYWVGEVAGKFFSNKGKGSLLDQAEVKCFGFNDADTNNERSKQGGYCVWTDADGDHAYSVWEANDTLGFEVKGTFDFTGGTGKYKGITGKNTWRSVGVVFGRAIYNDAQPRKVPVLGLLVDFGEGGDYLGQHFFGGMWALGWTDNYTPIMLGGFPGDKSMADAARAIVAQSPAVILPDIALMDMWVSCHPRGAVAGLVGIESGVVSGLENPNDSGVEAPVETTPWKALPRSLRSRIREMERAPSFLRTGSIRSNQRYAIKSGNSSKA